MYRERESRPWRRYHFHESARQRALLEADRLSGVSKPATCHTFRHSFATHLPEDGYDIRTVRQLLDHKNVYTTMIPTHVLNGCPMGVQSAAEGLDPEWPHEAAPP